MVSAFVFINCRFPFNQNILEILNKVQSVTNVYRTSGIYDVIVKVNAMTEKALVETISRDIRTINDVNSTVTMIIAER